VFEPQYLVAVGEQMTSFLKADRSPAVASWLFVVAILVLAMVMIGGATRLTDSGLSITEWKPVTGAIPPLSDQAWASEFAKYRATPQYRLVNEGMNLGQFPGHLLVGVGAPLPRPFHGCGFRHSLRVVFGAPPNSPPVDP